eukprot:CAMPEP_0204621452 /NCGR_PEP_ID=MMETSP0717-20131115/7152_1 /ASSEMBLY_ACC=CAM_ASM_000666 /TAXON_ID=230516 /ORGANISM="Chaetoceros curvisetus" /LENGTH=499 /DNA_ID=CAMNT_0051635857 /DNA_START=47 /DNA_END=1546 /DNA_ORIENTATION=+
MSLSSSILTRVRILFLMNVLNVFIIAAIIVMIPPVLCLSPLEAQRLTSRVTIRTGVELRPKGTSTNFDIQSVSAGLDWFPRESPLQKVSGFRLQQFPTEVKGAPRLVGDTLQLYWEDPGYDQRRFSRGNVGASRGSIRNNMVQNMNDNINRSNVRNAVLTSAELCVEANIDTVCEFVPVRQRIPFPLRSNANMPTEYLRPGRFANDAPQIRQLAQNIVARENELYHAVYAVANYVHRNIEYTLPSNQVRGRHAATSIQSASRVLSSRRGKCDEMTALFISMTRSLGIPSRFISGYAFTNHEMFDNDWGGHTWAEVFFPGTGWVPFDVTYGQYGYVDAGHIQLSETHDAESSSVQFHAKGMGFQPVVYELDTHVGVLAESGGGMQHAIEIGLDVQAGEVGFGSAAVVVATVRNRRDHFVAAQLNLGTSEDISMLNNDIAIDVLLEPGEVLEIPYFFLMDEKYHPDYEYEYPFSLSSRWSSTVGRTTILVRDGAPMFYARQ